MATGQLFLGEQIDDSHKRDGTKVVLATTDFTTHGVIVGMTGSGKTGLGIVLIEEALTAKVPCLVIDPKGDLGDLLLSFPDLAPADFRPWINDGDAQRAGLSADDFAAQQAQTWKDGLTSWGVSPDRISALRATTRFTIYTPGSNAGVPLNIVGSLAAPRGADEETVAEEIEGFVSGLLGLVGVDADPLSSREHILLSNIIAMAWNQGHDLDLAMLVGQVQQPPLRKLGVFDLDTFFPPADRTALALKLNALLASPSFAAWSAGPPMDVASMLTAPDGRPSCAIVSIAHLSDEERQFVVALLLSKVVTWMRRQSGTTDLRALIYMDEVAGYAPPTAVPPAKKPILLLLKQARAFGVGLVLATQNPVDVDYKALSNAGTWMVGRLQTEQDKSRLLDGMSDVAGGVDVNALSNTIAGLAKREFMLRRAGVDKPEVFTTRWAMSYLRGPLTRDQIASLMANAPEKQAMAPAAAPAPAPVPTSVPSAPPAPTPAGGAAGGSLSGAAAGGTAAAGATVSSATSAPATAAGGLAGDESPVLPEVAEGVPVRWLDPAAPWAATIGVRPTSTRLAAAAVTRVRLLYDDTKSDVRHNEEWEAVLYPLDQSPDPARAIAVDYDDRDLRTERPMNATYVLPDAPVKDKAFWAKLQRDLVDHLVRNRTVTVARNASLKLYARVGESDAEFARRCDEEAQNRADAESAKLKDKYQARLQRAQQAVDAAHDRAEIAASQKHASRASEILDAAGSILGGLFGGKRRTKSIINSVSKVAKGESRSRVAGQRADAASNRAQDAQETLDNLTTEISQQLTEIDSRWDEVGREVDAVEIPLEKTDVAIDEVVLVWIPVP